MQTANLVTEDNQLALFSVEVETTKEFIGSWTTGEIILFQKSMLIGAMKEIRDKRKSRKMRLEAWNWLMEDDSTNPFSSRICAFNNGYNIDVIRCYIRRIVKDIKPN